MKICIYKSNVFTLVELLVVIAIITILSAILLPVTGKIQTKARSIQCINNLKQNITAVIQYGGDYNYYLPSVNYAKPLEDPFADVQYTGSVTAYRSTYTTDNSYCVSYGSIIINGYIPNEKSFHCSIVKSLYKSPSVGDAYWKMNGAYCFVGGLKCTGWGSAVKPRRRLGDGPGLFIFRCILPGVSNCNDLHLTIHGNNASNTAYLDGHAESKKPVLLYWRTWGNPFMALDR